MIQKMKIPKVVEHEKVSATDSYGKFTAQPLEMGYGVTLGNALRRVLLASLPGTAISGVRIEGVFHEFSFVEGVKEDIPEIILNLKQVRFKSLTKKDTVVSLSISGSEEFKAGHIVSSDGDFEIVNPDKHIATLSKDASLKIELYITRGRGYVQGDEQSTEGKPLGYIGIDAIYTPIKNVTFAVENTRVEQRTDYEKLVLEVETDATVSPSDAVSMAARVIMDHAELFRQFSVEEVKEYEEITEKTDEEFERMRSILMTRVEDLELSVRSHNCLRAAQVDTLGQLVLKTESEIGKLKNFGRKSLAELKQIVETKGLYFGMDISRYKLKN